MVTPRETVMSGNAADPERLLDEAIDLVIRMQVDPDNPVSHDLVRSWRARSPAHEKVWARVVDAHGSAGKVITDQRREERRRSKGPTRRALMIGGAVALGGAAAGGLVLPGALTDARADHVTGKGEIRPVTFADGSVATLGPDSAIALRYTPQIRQVDLLKGASSFKTAADAARPFLVQALQCSASAAAPAAFDVSADAGLVRTWVQEGRIQLRAPGGLSLAEDSLSSDEWMAFDTAAGSADRGRRTSGLAASWRDKLILAENETVASLVAQVGRWLPGRVVIAAPTIGRTRISGLFDLSDPSTALEAVVQPVGGRIRRIYPFLTVISPV
jgi:transmembrane sensor